VAAVCKAATALDTAAGFPGRGAANGAAATTTGTDSATTDAGAPTAAGGSPGAGRGGDFAGRADAIAQAASTFVAALQAANPPDSLKDFNGQLVAAVNQAITALQSATRPAGFADRTPDPDRTPNPDRTPGAGRAFGSGATPGADDTPFANGGRPGGGQFGGALSGLLRDLPAPPSDVAQDVADAAAANSDCQAAGLAFTAPQGGGNG
jgi:hypothetical protein